MTAGVAAQSLEQLTQDVFEVMKQLALAAPRGRRRPGDLKESEFLTLAMLQEREVMTVGEIQRELDVLPAQMSRIIRSLERQPLPLITCGINALDKRKVNVRMTEEGARVLSDYRHHRVGRIFDVLRELDAIERTNLAAVLDRVLAILRGSGTRRKPFNGHDRLVRG